MSVYCHFCAERPNPEPVKVKAGYYIECSACDETGPIEPTPEEAWMGWNKGPFNPRREAE